VIPKPSPFSALLVLALLVVPSAAQDAEPPPPVEVSPLVGPLHRLQCNGPLGVAMVASVGEDGVLLVDTGYTGTADAVREAVGELSDAPVRLIVNTHGDGDHVGANATLGAAAVIVAHPGTRRQMSTFFALPTPGREGLPSLTLESEATIHFNDDVVRLLPVPGGHTAGDLVVHFTRSGVACLGDIVFTGGVPNADPARGGDARRLAEVLRMLERTLPEDTTLLPAHGGPTTMSELRDYIEMVEGTVAGVEEGVAASEDLEQILHRPSLVRWADGQPDRDAFHRWVGEIHAALTGDLRQSICAPMTEALVKEDIAAAVSTYRRLKAEEPERWGFAENELNNLGYQLLARGRTDEAVVVFELNAEAYPEAFNTWDSLGEAQLAAGQREKAIASYRRSLELNPDNTNAVAVLADVEPH
jgi:glyoxylase-like metal-dependent hydrolase (beta-lactamase superfamily II)